MKTKTTLSGQVARACEDPDFMSKWLWEVLSSARIDANDICSCPNKKTIKENQLTREQIFHQRVDRFKNIITEKGKGIVADREKRFQCDKKEESKNEAAMMEKGNAPTSLNNNYSAHPIGQWLPVLLMHIEDGILISFGWLIFMQCIAHAVFFWIFERLPIKTIEDTQLCIKLNSHSHLQEFGLEHWNHALNNLYWYYSAALIIPILSRISQPDLTDLDTSQVALQFAIPILVAIPMIATVLSRQSRLPACWQALDQKNEADAKSYLSQRLWPLDKNWSSKLGVVLAFIILSISFGINLATLL